jgi:hypothetical protein
LTILIDYIGYLGLPETNPWVLTALIASTASLAKTTLSGPISLEFIEVLAVLIKISVSSSVI